MVDYIRNYSRNDGLEALLIVGTTFPLPQLTVPLKYLQLAGDVMDHLSRSLRRWYAVGD